MSVAAIESLGRLSHTKERSKVWKILVPAVGPENVCFICHIPSPKAERWRGSAALVALPAYLVTPELPTCRDLEGVQLCQRPARCCQLTQPLGETATGRCSTVVNLFSSVGIQRAAGQIQLPGSDTGRGCEYPPFSPPHFGILPVQQMLTGSQPHLRSPTRLLPLALLGWATRHIKARGASHMGFHVNTCN